MKNLKQARIKVHSFECVFWYLPNDKFIGQRIALGKYEPYLTKLMLDQISEGDTVIDVGANIGYDTVLFAKKVGLKGKIYAIEPDPVNFEILLKNISDNRLDNVVPLRVAATSKEGTQSLFESEENLGDHRLYESGDRRKKIEVIGKSIDQILEELGEKNIIKLIKIDTQGFEPAVIEGAQKTIGKHFPTIFFEYWPWAYKKAKLNKHGMMKRLSKWYGPIYYIDEYVQVYLPRNKKWLESKFQDDIEDKYCNLLVKKKKDFWFNLGQIKDFWPKKWVKRMLGYPLT